MRGQGTEPRALRPKGQLLRRVLLIGVTAALAVGPTGGPASATFAGREGRIAFGDFNTGQIYAVNPDGTGLTQLTHTDDRHVTLFPEWTPDGRLTFSLVRAGTTDDHARMWIMNADGSGQHRLTGDAPGFRDYDANFTLDGRKIVFSRCRPDNGVCAIWIMRSDGTHKRPLTPYRGGRNEAIDFYPTVSPDGRHVAFTRFAWKGINAQVYVMRIDGSGEHPITPAALEAAVPDYSPDGRSIVVNSRAVRIGTNVYSVRADGSHLTRLTETRYPNDDFDPAYSPAGGRIAFGSDRRYDDFCCADLFSMSNDGSREHRIRTDGVNGVAQLTWGSARLVTEAEARRLSPVDPAPVGPALSGWCRSLPGFMRVRVC
jgi:Tol biopolymer transport system component